MDASTDTHPSAADVQLRLLREASPARRFALTCSLSSTVLRLARQGLRKRHPELTDEELGLLFVEVHYGKDLAERVRHYLEKRRS
jgi:hypothetical protein